MQSGSANRGRFRFASAICVTAALFLAVSTGRAGSAAAVQSASFTLPQVVAGLDKSAAAFNSMSGDLEYTKVTVIVNDHSTQHGRVYFEKTNGGKPRVMIAFRNPAEKYVLFSGDKVQLYQPKIAEVTEYKLSQSQDVLEQFLLLGFGTPGSELEKSYQLSVRGTEQLGGQQAVILELIPKSQKVSGQLKKIELWLSPENWQPVQQKFYEPSGDYVTARYTNVKWNQKLSDKDFKLPLKGKVKTVRPQGG